MKANPLGDIRAEADHEMLGLAFIETPDYKTLISATDRAIVVGRRGSGKSALAYGLAKHWRQVPKTRVVQLAPQEDQMIGLRPIIRTFGTDFNLLRAACRIMWRYALMLELAGSASEIYKFTGTKAETVLAPHIARWKRVSGFSGRLRGVLNSVLMDSVAPEEQIGHLSSLLEVDQVKEALIQVLPEMKTDFVVLIDKLDEGYHSDDVGTALADGLILATINVADWLPNTKVTLFARDNVARAVARSDPDYSRNIEGQILRLHWDEPLLIGVVCARLRMAFSLSDIESNLKVWNRCAGHNLRGMDGFRQCLRLTLYRPRDVLALLNQAFYRAAGQGRARIMLEDLESTAQEISETRLDDLHKEYKAILPGLSVLTASFAGHNPECTSADASARLAAVVGAPHEDAATQQHLEIVKDFGALVRSLYSVGFIGLRDPASGTFGYCHDGRSPSQQIEEFDKVLVHPCYWMALRMPRRVFAETEAEEIYDEYEIHIESQTPEIRKAQLGQHISALDQVPLGVDGAQLFEEWCLKAARILFAGELSNFALHSNRDAVQRRDIVATNIATSGVWRRIYEDYHCRQVVMEVKNQYELGGDEYRQMLSYLTGEYGKCGFIITRDKGIELSKDKEVKWVKELYDKHNGVLIVKLTGSFFASLLSKLRNPQRHDEANVRLNKILDTYTRLYLAGRVPTPKGGGRPKRRGRN